MPRLPQFRLRKQCKMQLMRTTREERIQSPQPTVSIVIPCHNHGEYLGQAIEAVLKQTYQNFEMIIVDDGSDDENTLLNLSNYDRSNVKLIRTTHQGLASARNTAIEAARGKYILPLDADDKIGETYLEKALGILETHENVGIVYSKAEFFGEAFGEWKLPPYHFPEILLENVIFCSALFRQRDWTAVNGYNLNMIYGWEDYDFWLSLIELGREVVRIPETLFFYRQRSDSMIRNMSRDHMLYSYAQLFKNHPQLYADNIGFLLLKSAERVDEFQRTIESSFSWRLTKPLRSTHQIIRSIRQRFSISVQGKTVRPYSRDLPDDPR
jgi:glycosyltransferase involved in cell wall biosynthesis